MIGRVLFSRRVKSSTTARVACALLVASLASPAGASPADPVPGEDRRWLDAHRVLRVGLETGYAPFSFVGPDGLPAGISIDTLHLLERRLGVRFEVVATGDLSTLLEKARGGEVDLLTSLTRTAEREAFLDFTRPYFTSPAVLVVRKDREGAGNLEAMAGSRIAVGEGYGVAEFLRRHHPAIRLVPAPNDAAGLRLVLSGEADGAVLDLASLSWILASTGLHGLRVLEDVGFTYDLAFASREGLPQLRRLLDEALAATPSADFRKIRDTWVHVEVAPRGGDHRVWAWLAFAIVGTAVLGMAIFGVNWALRREVARRTRELAASEARYRLLADHAEDVIWTLSLETGRYTYVSPSIRTLRGLTPEEALVEPVEESLTKESLRRVQEEMARIGTPDEQDPHTGIYDQPCRDGSVKHVEITTTLVRENGRAVQVLGVSRDATARVRAERAVERTQLTLLMLTRCSEAILRASTEEELFADVCRVIVETGGYRMCWVGVAENDERKTVRPVASAGSDDGYLATLDLVWADVPAGQGPTGTAIREGRVVVGHYLASEGELSPWRSEALQRGFASAMALPISFEGETVGALSMYSGDVEPIGDVELRFLRQLADDLAFGVHALRERTARVRADAEREAALRALASEQDRFRALIEGSSDLTLVVDRDGVIRFASPASREVLGYVPADLVGQPLLEHIHAEDHERARQVMDEVLAVPGAGSRVEVRVRRADGSHAPVESGLRNLLDVPGVEGIVINNRDITERNRLREQFQQAQKLESVGRLAGGVAHDFNNLLTIILSCGEEMRAEIAAAPSPLAREYLDDIITAGRRASDLTRQLLAFARKQVIAPEVVDLTALLRESKKLLGRVIGEDIRVIESYQADLWPVRCDPGLLGQVVMNLAVNGRDAMPKGGTLTLSTQNLDIRPGDHPPDPEMATGPWVRLGVRDTGVGMTPEVLAHVFEPFFTTKAPGVGTGLGLATVYGIVKQSGAHLTVRSAPGEGTSFDVFFPRAPDEARAVNGTTAAPAPGTETVLVVEDDPKVRDVAVRSLRGGGYRVLAADGADQAYEIVRRERAPIHLLVTDVVMPGTGGREMARRIGELRPGIRVLYVSGYTHDAISQQGVLDEGIEFLPKPFTATALLARVRAVLDRA